MQVGRCGCARDAVNPTSVLDPTPRRPWAAALESRNFRLLWRGQACSLTGTMMQNAAVLWHVTQLAAPDQRAWALGLVGLARVIPILALALFAGVLADAVDRRRMMMGTQVVMALVAVCLWALTATGEASLEAVLLLTALTAAAAAFDAPARSALVPTLVPAQHIPNAVSLNTTMFQLACVIGPALAGIALATTDISWIYLANALSFAPVVIGLACMRNLPVRPAGQRVRLDRAALVEGVRFSFSQPILRGCILVDFVACFFSAATGLLPLVAQDLLGVGAAGYGWLYAAPSIGAVLASTWMVRHADGIRRRGRVMLGSAAALGCATVGLGLSREFALTFACLALVGAADTVNMVVRNVLRQLITPDRLRGRMSSVNVIFGQGGPQLGELEAGSVAQLFGVTTSIVSGGLACLLGTGWIAWCSPALRDDGVEHVPMPAPVPGRISVLVPRPPLTRAS